MARIIFENLPSTNTPINATNLNKVSEGTINVGTSVDDTYKTNIVIGKNLFNKATALSGVAIKRSTGEETSLSNYTSSAFIQVQPSTQYYLGIAYSSTNYGVCYYTNTGTFISGERLDNRFTTPSNCYYIRFSFQTANYDINTIQLEKGSVATTYEAYITPSIVVEDREIYNKDNLDIYSTGETRVGNWLGKPLYRRVITGTLDSSGSMDIFTLTNCDVLVNIKGSIVSPSSYKIPFPFYNSATSFVSSALSSTNHIYVYFSSNFNTSNYKIVLEYTKTTD